MSRLMPWLGRLGAASPEAPAQDQQQLIARVEALEAMVEGLQDSVDRQVRRQDDRLDELTRRLEPGELARTLSADARKRGL
jgi:hypothetical protein